MKPTILRIAAVSLLAASLSPQIANAAVLTTAPPPPSTPGVAASSGSSSSSRFVEVCFFEKPEFEGAFFCESGSRGVLKVDARWRDKIKSIQIVGDGAVKICNDFGRKGDCETLSESDPQLAPELFNKVYSYRTSL